MSSWLPVNLGSIDLGDFAGAVNKLSESVKNIEKNFDTSFGFERSEESTGLAPDGRLTPPESVQVAPPVPTSKADVTTFSPAPPIIPDSKQELCPSPTTPTDTQPSLEQPRTKPQEEELMVPQSESEATPAALPPPPETLPPLPPHTFLDSDTDIPNGNVVLIENLPSHTQEEPSSNLKPNPETHSAVEPVEENISIAGTDSALNGVNESVLSPNEVPEPQQIAKPVPEPVLVPAAEPEVSVNPVLECEAEVSFEEESEQAKHERIAEPGSEEEEERGIVNKQGESDAVESVVQSEEHPADKLVVEHGTNGTVGAVSGGVDVQETAVIPVRDEVADRRPEDGDEGTEENEKVEALVQVEPKSRLVEEAEGQEEAGDLPPSVSTVGVELHKEQEEGRVVSEGEALREQELKRQLAAMEAALQSAGKQAQSKADELVRYMNANDELKGEMNVLQKQMAGAKVVVNRGGGDVAAELTGDSGFGVQNSAEAEMAALREEYQQRLSGAERKVYALTKERDMLRRDQSRKGDSAALLKEKDEMIKQVMAEGEELSRKQAGQEAQMKKLRSQIREHEESEQRLTSHIEVEEAKVEALKKDKAATEHALQEAVERSAAEVAVQKEYFSKVVAESKAALLAAEARVDSEAKADLDRRLKDSSERERSLVRSVDELRQTLSRAEQQASFREDMLRREVDDLERRCQSAEARHEDLVARMPDSTRPLLRQMEAMQESANMRVEALTGVERALNMRLQEAEGKAASAEERERTCNERLTQTLSRCAVMEAQLSLLRAEQSQMVRSLEKERSRAAENRQEYLAAQEAAAVQEGRARQLEGELKEARARARREVAEERARRDALEGEVEAERAAMADYEKRIRAEGRAAAEKALSGGGESGPGRPGMRRLGGSSSGGSIEEHSMLAASLGGAEGGGHLPGGMGSRNLMGSAGGAEQIEKMLRHREGELASYGARVAALEATRDSLAEELVGTTQALEMSRNEAQLLPGMRQELEALRLRHASALELMGERDEQVEELRADLADVKELYREQIDMLVRQIERLSNTVASALGKESE